MKTQSSWLFVLHRLHSRLPSNYKKSRSRSLTLRLLEICGVCLLTAMSKIVRKSTREWSRTYLNELPNSWKSLISRDGQSWTSSGSKRINISIHGTENLSGQWLLGMKDPFNKINKCHNNSSSCLSICLIKDSTHRLPLMEGPLCMMKPRCSSWWETNR